MKGRHKWSNWSEVFLLVSSLDLFVVLTGWQPLAWEGAGCQHLERVVITNTRIQIRKYHWYSGGCYGGLNGPGMNKKFDGNTLWSTFYCLEDVIHGAHCNNISIDIIMPPLRCKFFSQAKREKQILTLPDPLDTPLLSLSLLCLSWLRSVEGGTWPGLAQAEWKPILLYRSSLYTELPVNTLLHSQWNTDCKRRKGQVRSANGGY